MAEVYSTYEAKARFSELLRKVRSGKRVVIAYHGEEIAEIRPIDAESTRGGFAKRLARLERDGVVGRHKKPTGPLRPIVKRPGALARFLESRD